MERVQGLIRDVLPGEWAAFDRYSPRIHEFISLFSSGESMGVDDIELDIFLKIQRLRPGRELFSALRVLITPLGLNKRSRSPLVNPGEYLAPLMSSRLVVVHLSLARQLMRNVCSQLEAQAPRLRELRLVGPLLKGTIRIVLRFHNIQYLDINYKCVNHPTPRRAYIKFLNNLSNFNHLNTLLLYPPLSLQSDRLSTFGFQNLSRLGITGNIQSFTTICCMTPHIRHAIFYTTSEEPLSNWLYFLDNLQSRCGFIQHLEIHTKFPIDIALQRVVDFLKPLQNLKLTALRMSSAQPFLKFRLSDDDVRILGTWWPRLRHLDLFATCQYLPPDVPTFQSVVALVNSCHDMQHLRMSVWNQCINMPTSTRGESTREVKYAPFGAFGVF
jgi:hypothetical protein